MNLDELVITNVRQYRSRFSKIGYTIVFKINNFSYRMYVNGEVGQRLFPTEIVHWDERATCTFCKEATYDCQGLSRYKPELFHRLIQFPSVRLEWLYIDHV